MPTTLISKLRTTKSTGTLNIKLQQHMVIRSKWKKKICTNLHKIINKNRLKLPKSRNKKEKARLNRSKKPLNMTPKKNTSMNKEKSNGNKKSKVEGQRQSPSQDQSTTKDSTSIQSMVNSGGPTPDKTKSSCKTCKASISLKSKSSSLLRSSEPR